VYRGTVVHDIDAQGTWHRKPKPREKRKKQPAATHYLEHGDPGGCNISGPLGCRDNEVVRTFSIANVECYGPVTGSDGGGMLERRSTTSVEIT